ncbi:MAG: LamG domain-containing protein [Hamadaea sp.]|uniref:LamG-like jellyroll fold domain-containing protein n=1 Tax=Hamadaea sp. TaxID=2024425 RepID=UPI0017DA1DAD|nr:LamG-like jellyroll fold domain-containing protein [Hamadaea sp.]NUR74643.1 LamG domain-containing protein [Hamadaea sp.]NUT21147.1 LamG domain-containing protein [Hamadaea sp.]
MKGLRLTLGSGVGLLAVLLATVPAPASPTADVRTPDQRRAAGEPVTLRYAFDAGLADPIWDADRTLRLHPVGVMGGALTAKARAGTVAVGYPSVCQVQEADCPRVVLESDPAAWLNPGQADVSWGAQVLLESQNTSDGENVVQKGFSTQGTQYKLQVDHLGGLPSCVVAGLVFGVNRIYVAQWRRTVADGAWHRLDCVRRSTGLALFVDGELRASTAIPAQLSIVNGDPLRLGGKGIGPWNDQFHGILDDVYVTVG